MTPRSNNPPLSRDLIYNDLNGEECRAILLQRITTLLAICPMFVRHLTLPRVKMTVNITLEVFECEPPIRTLTDEVVVRSPGQLGEGVDDMTGLPLKPHVYDGKEVIDTFNNAPDQIREEHGLPIATPTRHPLTKQHVDVMVASGQPAPPLPAPGPPRVPYNVPVEEGQVRVTLDRGGPVSTDTKGERQNYKQGTPGVGVVGNKNAERGKPEVEIQTDFKDNVLRKGVVQK